MRMNLCIYMYLYLSICIFTCVQKYIYEYTHAYMYMYKTYTRHATFLLPFERLPPPLSPNTSGAAVVVDLKVSHGELHHVLLGAI